MNKTSLIFIILFAGLLLFNSCVSYRGDVLNQTTLPRFSPPKTRRDCSIEIRNVVDLRKDTSFDGVSPNSNLFVPLLLLYWGKISGPKVTLDDSSFSVDPNLLPNLKQRMEDAIIKSRLFSGKGKKYILKCELLHCYGAFYWKSKWFFSFSGDISSSFGFWPTGYLCIQVKLVDPDANRTIATRYLSNAFLFNPQHPQSDYSAYRRSEAKLFSQSIKVAMISISHMLGELPLLVDQMLADHVVSGDKTAAAPKNFRITRLTPEYDFIEEILIEYSTGRIIYDRVIRRREPICSKPDEWIVSPIQNGHWLSNTDYRKLVTTLKGKYKVQFDGNLNASIFRGAL